MYSPPPSKILGIFLQLLFLAAIARCWTIDDSQAISWLRSQFRSFKRLIGLDIPKAEFECGISAVPVDLDRRSPRIYAGLTSTVSIRDIPSLSFENRHPKWHSWPWVVSIVNRQKPTGFLYSCAGTVVTPDTIITAAHCVTDTTVPKNETYRPTPAKFIKVIAGVHTLLGQMNIFNYYGVRSVHLYEQYYDCCRGDLAIIRLNEKLRKSKKVNSICLPDPSIGSLEGLEAVIAGWGIQTESPRWYSTNSITLKHGFVEILSAEKCQAHKYHDPQDELCALNTITKTDARAGDSGGPLMIQKHGRWILVGITSHGLLDNATLPGYYSRVAEKMDWISSKI